MNSTTSRLMRRFAPIVAGGLTMAALTALPAPTAQAATYDGTNPYTSSCWSSAKIVKSLTMWYDKVTVDLMYSTTCRTVWMEMSGDFPYNDRYSMGGRVQRNSDGKKYGLGSAESANWMYYANHGLTTVRWTPMLNDAGVSSYAVGTYQDGGLLVTKKTGSY